MGQLPGQPQPPLREKRPTEPAPLQVVGPTLGAVVGLVTAVVCWPAGAAVWLCDHYGGRSLMAVPAGVYRRVSGPIPI